MQTEKGSNLPRIKVSNQAAIRRMIYRHGPITRAAIAEQLGLTLPTITTNINSMIACGIINEVDEYQSPNKSMGRKANLVNIVPDSKYFIGVEMRRNCRHLCITNYRGDILASEVDTTFYKDYDDCIKYTAELVAKLLSSKFVPTEKIEGIGLCLPGIVDSNNGVLNIHPQYGWENKTVRQDLKELTGFNNPITIENDACARAVSMQLFNREMMNNISSFAYLFVSDGLSCPLILNNSSFSSSCLGPGELGYMIIDSKMPYDELGCTGRLSSFSGERAVLDTCENAIAKGESPLLAEMSQGKRPTIKQVLIAQEKGEESVSQIVSTALTYLGIAVANVNNFVHPHSVFIDAQYFSSEQNQQHFLDIVRKNSFRPTGIDTNYIFVKYNSFQGALGGAAVAIQHDLEIYID